MSRSLSTHSLLVVLFALACTTVSGKPTIFPGAGYGAESYLSLRKHLGTATDVCVAHSADGAQALRAEIANCTSVVFLGVTPSLDELQAAGNVPVLVVAGSLDGVSRFSRFAALRHLSTGLTAVRFAVIRGAAHASFASGSPTELVEALDLVPDVTAEACATVVASLVADLLGEGSGEALVEAELAAKALAQPLIDALELEGSEALGKKHCNSDFPTNPACNYPKYPDFALGKRAPAPSPALPADCICGSEWVASHASPVIAGVDANAFTVASADSFHDVSDTHPFHLPHIWSACKSPSGCELNMTSLSMDVHHSDSLFPENVSAPLSAFELKTKLKSRAEVYAAAGVNATNGDVDKNTTMCRSVNQAAYDWALNHAEASVKTRFLSNGLPLVMVDDVEAPIGITGPTWIKKELVYTRKSDRVEIQSWSFVVGSSPIKSKFIPAGMHYCKLLSPARAMEWIYTDSLRRY